MSSWRRVANSIPIQVQVAGRIWIPNGCFIISQLLILPVSIFFDGISFLLAMPVGKITAAFILALVGVAAFEQEGTGTTGSKANSLGYTDEALKDQVFDLPGTDNIDITFNQFSGYLKISDTKNIQ